MEPAAASRITSSRLTRFLITAALLYVGWYFLYNYLIHDGGTGYAFDLALCRHIADASALVLGWFGFKAYAGGPLGTFLHLQGWHVVSVGWQCDGLPLMALFAGFVIAYPGPWRAKLWFIPAGILVIHLINILRVVALALNQAFWRATTDFNHHYTFQIIVYGVIFWLWTIWVRRFAHRAPANLPPPAAPAAAASVAASPTSSNA